MAHFYYLIGLAVMAVTCAAALWLGDKPAKLMAGGCATAWLATLAAQKRHDFYNPQYGVAAVDAALLVFVIALAVIYRRDWLMAAGGFVMLVVATHVAFIIDLRIVSNIRITAAAVWSYLTLFCLMWGTWSAWRARMEARARTVGEVEGQGLR